MEETEEIFEEKIKENIYEEENIDENDNEIIFNIIQKNFTIDLNTDTSLLIIDQNNIKLNKEISTYSKNYYQIAKIINNKGTFYYSSSSNKNDIMEIMLSQNINSNPNAFIIKYIPNINMKK